MPSALGYGTGVGAGVIGGIGVSVSVGVGVGATGMNRTLAMKASICLASPRRAGSRLVLQPQLW